MGEPRVLLIEDDENVAAALLFALRQRYAVEWASRATEGMIRLRESRPDLVLLDVQLPDGDGREVYANIRAERIETPVILMSGGVSVHTNELDERAAFLRKPFSADEVEVTFRRLLG